MLGLVDPGRVYEDERRTLGPPLRFGFAVARHLARHGRDYDVVHTASFPFFSVLAAAAPGGAAATGSSSTGTRCGHALTGVTTQVSSPARSAGSCSALASVVRAARVLHVTHERPSSAGRGFRGRADRPSGHLRRPGAVQPDERGRPALVVYAGRHVREKRVRRARARVRQARAKRPEPAARDSTATGRTAATSKARRRAGPRESVRVARHRPEDEVAAALARAACLATASEREGYGLVVVEAAARGTPSVVVAGPENAAPSWSAEGVNGAVAASAEPADARRGDPGSWRPGRSFAGRQRAGSRNARRVCASTRRSS